MSLCHRVSQSFTLPPATKPVSHLPCPMPPNQSVIWLALYQHITGSPCHHVTVLVSHLPCPLPPNQSVIWLALYHHITVSPCHCVSQSFTLPPATKPVSHLPCPMPPNQSVIWLALYQHITTSPCHHVTVLVSHLPCPLPPNQSVICLAPCHQTSQSFDLPSTTMSPHHRITTSPCHCITTSPCHCITVLVSHLPCPLPPNQSVICLAPCHQTSQSFDLPSTNTSPHQHVTMALC